MQKFLHTIYKKTNIVILLGIISLTSILIIQVAWIKKSIAIQDTNIAINEKEHSLNLKEFSLKIYPMMNK